MYHKIKILKCLDLYYINEDLLFYHIYFWMCIDDIHPLVLLIAPHWSVLELQPLLFAAKVKNNILYFLNHCHPKMCYIQTSLRRIERCGSEALVQHEHQLTPLSLTALHRLSGCFQISSAGMFSSSRSAAKFLRAAAGMCWNPTRFKQIYWKRAVTQIFLHV